jgi:regulator of RNase E activity RraA
VISRANAAQVVDASRRREAAEVEITRRIRAGETTLDIYNLHAAAASA